MVKPNFYAAHPSKSQHSPPFQSFKEIMTGKSLDECGKEILQILRKARNFRREDETHLRELLNFSQSRRNGDNAVAFEVAEEAFQFMKMGLTEHEKLIDEAAVLIRNTHSTEIEPTTDACEASICMHGLYQHVEEDLYTRKCLHADLHLDSSPEDVIAAIAMADVPPKPVHMSEKFIEYFVGERKEDPRVLDR